MNSKNFINFHVLISHSPSCLNRDDMNMQKSAIFGGVRRVRISSQSLKRAMRTSPYYKTHLPEKSIRTRQLNLLVENLSTELLKDSADFDKHWIEKAVFAFVSNNSTTTEDTTENDAEETEDEQDSSASDKKKIAVAPWSISEFKVFYKLVKETFEAPLSDKEEESLSKLLEKERSRKPTKKNPKKSDEDIKGGFLLKKTEKVVKEQANTLLKACGQAVDIALSGRMATSGLMTNMDGAMAVAHAITTHAVDADIDWFTAVDDLVSDAGEVGAGHLNTQEFSSGVFYRYASLNIAQLQKNLGGVARERALEIAKYVLHMLATVVPSAKNQSTAPFNLADYVLVSFSDIPVSLANAFEKPVKDQGGFLAPSIKCLKDYWRGIHVGYGLDEKVAVFQVGAKDESGDLLTFAALPELENWVASNANGAAA